MIELRDNDGWIADLNPDKISAYGVRPATQYENGIVKDHQQFFVVCDSREFTSNLEPMETFERFRLALGFKEKTVRGPLINRFDSIGIDIGPGSIVPHQ